MIREAVENVIDDVKESIEEQSRQADRARQMPTPRLQPPPPASVVHAPAPAASAPARPSPAAPSDDVPPRPLVIEPVPDEPMVEESAADELDDSGEAVADVEPMAELPPLPEPDTDASIFQLEADVEAARELYRETREELRRARRDARLAAREERRDRRHERRIRAQVGP